MKIIVAYASAGKGHFKAAEAIYNYLASELKGSQLELVDVLQKSNALFGNLYALGYRFTVSYAPCLWALGFWLTYVKCLRRIIKWTRFIINRLNTNNFGRYVCRENPDFIVSTHFLPSEVSAYLKRTQKINSKLITLITDFGVHPFWVSHGTDVYVVASDFTREQLILEGVRENNIKVFGIPIEAKFLKQYEKSSLCKKFKIDQNAFTALIITGSFGIGPIEKIVDLLHKDVQLLAVCANNKRLYARLESKNYPNAKIFGFVDYVQELMAVSDVIITKPGGLTISEVLAMELAPIFIYPIPGQETENIRALEKYGIGQSAKRVEDIENIVLDYKEHPDKLNRIREKIRAIKKPDALKELCDAIRSGGVRTAG